MFSSKTFTLRLGLFSLGVVALVEILIYDRDKRIGRSRSTHPIKFRLLIVPTSKKIHGYSYNF